MRGSSGWLLADEEYLPPMFEGGEITLALVTTVTAVAIVFGLIVWNHRSMKRTLQCHSCRHPFHQSHPDRCIECGKRWRNKPFLSLWITFPLITIIVISGLTYPAWQAYKWSAARGFSPPLPKYKYTLVHRYPTGHEVFRKYARDYRLGSEGNDLLLHIPDDDTEIHLGSGSRQNDGSAMYGPLPVDITGDGLLDVVVSGRAGYWHHLKVFSLQPDGSFIKTLDADGYFQALLQDLDHDGTFELIEGDSGFSYTFAPRAFFDVPSMTSSFDGTSWVCDTEFMMRPPPDPSAFNEMKERLRGNDWSEWPDPDEFMYPMLNDGSRELWSAMLDLTYAGHGRMALDLHESVWPDDAGNKDAGLDYFLRTLREDSSIWEDLKAMQDPPVVEFESIPESERKSD